MVFTVTSHLMHVPPTPVTIMERAHQMAPGSTALVLAVSTRIC